MNNNNIKIPLIVIVGPTASGKTSLSINLAKKYSAEIVSADSMQIYKGMDIATAKPTIDEMQEIPHHLIGFVDIDLKFSVADYLKYARNSIDDITQRGKKAILVGGTGLYVNSLVDNIQFTEENNTDLRKELTESAKKIGGKGMLLKLAKLDPEYAKKLHSNDLTRIIRGIEINKLTGKTMKENMTLSRLKESPYNPFMIGINFKDRQNLYKRINRRVDLMIENGLVEEAKYFYNKFDANKTAIQAIGYKELFPYLSGNISLDEAADNLKKATRNYAKRQLTWFRKDERINWIYADDISSEEIMLRACKYLEDNGLN